MPWSAAGDRGSGPGPSPPRTLASRPTTERNRSARSHRVDTRTGGNDGRSIILLAAVCGLLLRLPLIFGRAGELNSDEAFTGIIAREAMRGHFYWIFPGQLYEGTLEAFAAAPLQALFGPSAPLLKLVSAAFWAVAALLVDLAARATCGTRPGVVFALMWIFSSFMLYLSTTSVAGYGSGLLCAAVGYWAYSRSVTRSWRHIWIFVAGVGFGSAVWQQPTFLPTMVGMTAGMAALSLRRATPAFLRYCAGVLTGLAPILTFNAMHDWRGLRSPGYDTTYSYWERLSAVATRLVPRGLGTQLVDGRATVGTIPTYVLLAGVLIAVLASGIHLWRHHPASRPILVVAGINTFGIAAFSNAWFTDDARYFVSFVPPFAILLGAAIPHVRLGHRRLGPGALIGALIVTLAVVPIYRDGRLATGHPNGDVPVLIGAIRAAGLRCAVGDYWSTHRLDYLADGRLHAAADPPYVVRISHLLDEIVAHPGRFARIAPAGSWFDARYENEAGDDWRRIEVSGTAIFLPTHPGPDVRTAAC